MIDDGTDQLPIADDVSPPAATAFPLDEGGTALPEIGMGVTTYVRFRAEIVEPFPSGVP